MGERGSVPDARVLTDGGAVAATAGGRPTPVRPDPTHAQTITVPATPEGVATAVSHLSAAHRTTGPKRSHPSWRDHPPRVAFGDPAIPPAVRRARPETGIVLRLPAALEPLYVTAPLAYYLGATVTVTADATPGLTAPSAGVARRLGSTGALADDVAGVLRRCFFLDALVRDVPGERLAGRRRLCRTLGVRPERLRALDPADRLRAYLDVDGVEAHLPDWHLATYVEPEPGRARSLPYLLDAMSLVYPPEASELAARERLQRSLDGFYRTRGEVASVDVVAPSLGDGDLHAWLAEGTPIQAYKSTHGAYENARRHRGRDRGDARLAVVVNDDAMAAERTVADIYRDRPAGDPVSVTVHEALRTDELAAVFATPHDFVHYVGHCDADGLRCPDGNLAAADIDVVRTRTFFLNACGSFHQGRALVDRGSGAGAVTLSAVLDEQAATVGRTFARLLVSGFSVAAALDLSRRRIMMGTDYGVVGDGTTAPIEADDPPAVVHLTETDDDRYRVRYEVSAPRRPGATYPHPFAAGSHLPGADAAATLDPESLRRFLRRRSLPVVYDDRFVWSDALADRL